MTTHAPHPAIQTSGLADNCERCAEMAEHPFETLDADNLALLWMEMVRVEVNDAGPYRSAAEARAARVLYRHYVFLTRYVKSVDPTLWPPR